MNTGHSNNAEVRFSPHPARLNVFQVSYRKSNHFIPNPSNLQWNNPALTSKIYSVYIKSVFWLFCSLYLTDSPQKSRTSPLPFYCTFLFDRYLPSSPPFLNCIQILLVFFSLIRIHFLLFACFSTHSAGAGAFAACSPLLSSTASPMLL